MEYRDTIGVDKNERFGVELEFSDVRLARVKKEGESKGLPIKYIYKHYNRPLPFNIWYLDEDTTVTEEIFGQPGIKRLVGGELSSRILKDTPSDWREIRKICEFLKSLKAKTNTYCSSHVTVNITTLDNPNDLLRTLSQVVAVYEPELHYFYMGDKYERRALMDEYASLIRPRVFTEERSYIESLPDSKQRIPLIYTSMDAIRVKKGLFSGPQLLEFRYPNGTLNAKTIQNNINFTLKLIEAIASGNFNGYRLNREIHKALHEVDSSRLNQTALETTEARDDYFDELVETITREDADKEAFYRQFQKVKSTKI